MNPLPSVRLGAAFLLVALGTSSRAQELRVGQAVLDITPPPGMPFQVPQRPPFQVVSASGTHDPLLAKAVVFDDGDQRAAIVACDLTSIPADYITQAREFIAKTCTVPPDNVMIMATHTHTGPNIRPRFFQNASPEQKKIAADYITQLPQRIAECVRLAEQTLTAARLQATIGEVPGVAFNRRYLMKDGSVVSNPHKGEDALLVNVRRPAGPTDDTLPMLYAESTSGRPIATLFNFAIHLDTTGGEAYSADFPYQVAKILADVKGPEMLSLFTMGAAGNVNHYDLLNPLGPRRTKGLGEAARIGTLIAAELVRGYGLMQPITISPVKVSREVIRLRLLEEKAAGLAKQFGNKPEFHDGELMVRLVDGQYTFAGEVMVITVGDDLAFVGMPGEMFVELGLAVKTNSPYPITFINTLARGTIGYVPNLKAYSEGSYGATTATTRSHPGTGETLVESAIRQLIEHRAMQRSP